MICTIVLSYTLIMLNGQVLDRVKFLDDPTSNFLILKLYDDAFLKEAGIRRVKNLKLKIHKPFDCATLEPIHEK